MFFDDEETSRNLFGDREVYQSPPWTLSNNEHCNKSMSISPKGKFQQNHIEVSKSQRMTNELKTRKNYTSQQEFTDAYCSDVGLHALLDGTSLSYQQSPHLGTNQNTVIEKTVLYSGSLESNNQSNPDLLQSLVQRALPIWQPQREIINNVYCTENGLESILSTSSLSYHATNPQNLNFNNQNIKVKQENEQNIKVKQENYQNTENNFNDWNDYQQENNDNEENEDEDDEFMVAFGRPSSSNKPQNRNQTQTRQISQFQQQNEQQLFEQQQLYEQQFQQYYHHQQQLLQQQQHIQAQNQVGSFPYNINSFQSKMNVVISQAIPLSTPKYPEIPINSMFFDEVSPESSFYNASPSSKNFDGFDEFEAFASFPFSDSDMA